jgi:hypothetical protein
MDHFRIVAALSTSLRCLSGMTAAFANVVKERRFGPNGLAEEIRDNCDVFSKVAAEFVFLANNSGRDPRETLRLKHLAQDIQQLSERFKELLLPVELLQGAAADRASHEKCALVVGLEASILAALAFSVGDLFVTERRLSALFSFTTPLKLRAITTTQRICGRRMHSSATTWNVQKMSFTWAE